MEYITDLGEKSNVAILYDNGLHVWTEDLNGRVIEEGSDKRKIYFQTKAKGYEVTIRSSLD